MADDKPISVSGIGSLNAPFVYTDWIGPYGHNAGIASFTLEAIRMMEVGGNEVHDRVVVVHLRMPLHTMAALKDAIGKVEAMLKPPVGTKAN
jgi:hypothetical protein